MSDVPRFKCNDSHRSATRPKMVTNDVGYICGNDNKMRFYPNSELAKKSSFLRPRSFTTKDANLMKEYLNDVIEKNEADIKDMTDLTKLLNSRLEAYNYWR